VYMMMVAKLVCTIFIRSCLWLLLLPGLTRAMESDITCLRSLKSQLKDPHAYLSNWVFGDYSDGYICSFFGMYCYRSSLNKVLSINLGGSGLEGEFPSGVKLCSFMESLNLTGNNLTGTLPSDTFSSLPFLVTLDLSNNNLAGEIPASLPNMSYLNTLLLDHNRFTGRIPSELASSPGLLQFSVAHNDLKGPIPEFTAGNISLSSFDDNPDLCGFPLDPCQDSFYSMAIIAANIAAAAFFPVHATAGYMIATIRINDQEDFQVPTNLRPKAKASAELDSSMEASEPKTNYTPTVETMTSPASSSAATTSVHVSALDGLVNVNSLFTIAVFVGLSIATPGQHSLELRSSCDASADVARKLLVFEVVSFSFFLFSSLVAQGLKLALNLLNSKDVDEIFRAHINITVLRWGMMASAVGSVMGCLFLMMSMVNVIQIRLGLLSCGSESSAQAVATLVTLVSSALLVYISTAIYAFWH
ncbi:LOW QUALITY PROTEIN: hypothetical protein HID58_011077, partial [Brassica napus]